ncbi:Hypothetical predicted protein [Mytilus galloprovincialis]|uniref:Uncharacterized protein n=1 Tax=Mytilus galloprovincialis TaxID=29158 RepID=A0A8B6HCJ2_MYTGA|nr:Hypothetical predicted protein [Mytilus galloprovincialis]
MSIAPIMMPILVTFFYMIILLRVEGVRNENNEASMTKQKTSPANRREISDDMTDKWQTNYKRESLNVDSKVDEIMFSLQEVCFHDKPKKTSNQLLKDTQSILNNIDVYSDIVKLNKQLRNKLKWIVEGKYYLKYNIESLYF